MTVHAGGTHIGGATVLKVGDNFASGASQKKISTPTFWPVEDKILLR